MEFRKLRSLSGPNIWANSPVLEAWVDLKDLKDTSSAMVEGFTERLMAWLPGLIEHECSLGRRGGFLERLREGTYPAHILEHVALELQGLAGTPVGYGRARETAEEGVYRVVIKYQEETVARASLETARELILAAMTARPYDTGAAIQRLRRILHIYGLDPDSAAVVRAARERGIPCQRIGGDSLLVLGQGVRQIRFRGVETDRTSATAASIAKDKDLTRFFLRAAGVPVPDGQPVRTAEEAWDVAEELGTPVVVKPQEGGRGRGVATNLTTREQVVDAFNNADKFECDILVERYMPGDSFRLLVVGGELTAAVRHDRADVLGDGRSTVVELVDRANSGPRRGVDHRAPPRRLVLDEEALEVLTEQELTPDSVAPAGARVLLSRNPNSSLEGSYTDVTDMLHPEVAAAAVRAARAVGLDVAGLDVVARDITRPPGEGGMAVIEVNSGPGLSMYLQPDAGQPRPVAEAILENLFPRGDDGRIPVVAITGVNGKTTTTRLIAHMIRRSGLFVGMACTDGLYLGDRRIDPDDCAGPRSARSVLLNSEVEAAVLEAARGGILRQGLGFDRCAVAVVTNIGEGDHLGMEDVLAPEDIVRVKRTVVDVVLPTGWAVLNAADPLVAGMAPYCRGGVIYFTRDVNHRVIHQRRAAGERAAFVRDGHIVLAEGVTEDVLVGLDRVPLTRGGRIGFQVENVLAAAAAGWALRLSPAVIRDALATFDSEPAVTPGRFNVLRAMGATVIVDFGHNPSAMKALVASLGAFEGSRRTVVLSADGDRSDEVIVRQAEILAPHCDRVVLYEEPARNRRRATGEIPALLRRGLGAAGRALEIVEVFGERAAITRAVDELVPGEVLLVLIDAVESSLDLVRRLLRERNEPGVGGHPRG
jgi:cyanophycin synthetase